MVAVAQNHVPAHTPPFPHLNDLPPPSRDVACQLDPGVFTPTCFGGGGVHLAPCLVSPGCFTLLVVSFSPICCPFLLGKSFYREEEGLRRFDIFVVTCFTCLAELYEISTLLFNIIIRKASQHFSRYRLQYISKKYSRLGLRCKKIKALLPRGRGAPMPWGRPAACPWSSSLQNSVL